MILHRLEIAGFRCFSSKVALVLDPERITILHGKNGSGKSSLLWALIRGLLDSHRAGGKSVEALRPWGTDLGSAIVVEFEDQGKRYRLEKNFLENRCARLAEVQGAKLKPLAQNEKAEERVREILLSETPTVGLTKPEKWGLARVAVVSTGAPTRGGLRWSSARQHPGTARKAGNEQRSACLTEQGREAVSRILDSARETQRRQRCCFLV